MKTKLAITTLILFLAFNSFGQDSLKKQKDLSLGIGLIFNQYSTVPGKSFNLTYRSKIKKKIFLKVGVNADYLTSQYKALSRPIYVSDTILILGESKMSRNQFSGRVGFDYQVTKIFYAGAELKIGQTKRTHSTVTNGFKESSNSSAWENCYECVSEFYGDEPTTPEEIDPSQTHSLGRLTQSTEKLLNYGILLNLGLDIPLNNHYIFAVQGTFETIWDNSNDPFSNIKIPISCNIMIRYRF